MATPFYDSIVASIDVGTTKISVLVAKQRSSGLLEIIAIGRAPSHGLKKGVVVDVAKTVQSISQAIQEAQLMAGMPISRAAVGISGGHIRSFNSHGVVPIKTGQVTQYDMANVLASAKAVPLEQGHHILHVLPQFFTIDTHERVHNPLGMKGIRLEVQAHVIAGALSSVHNLITCCNQAGVQVSDIILEQLASADAVLSPDEKELGVGVLDIGGGTSDFALYQHDAIRHTMVLPVAGNHFTQDIAIGLRTTLCDAERIKKEYGVCYAPLLHDDEPVNVCDVDGQTTHAVKRSALLNILHARGNELLILIAQEVDQYHLRSFMPAGLVLTGGGSLLYGMKELAAFLFKVPVRIGVPSVNFELPQTLCSPIYATGYGLLLYSTKQRQLLLGNESANPVLKRILQRMKSWVSDFF